jgi:DNA-binding NtrC family response regulator
MGRPITQINQRDLERLQAYDFPGNVRELINLVERAVITSDASTLNLGASLRALRRTERSAGSGFLPAEGERLLPLEEMQRLYIEEALRRTGGKVTGPGGAAEVLDINGRTLMSRMVKLGIERGKF